MAVGGSDHDAERRCTLYLPVQAAPVLATRLLGTVHPRICHIIRSMGPSIRSLATFRGSSHSMCGCGVCEHPDLPHVCLVSAREVCSDMQKGAVNVAICGVFPIPIFPFPFRHHQSKMLQW